MKRSAARLVFASLLLAVLAAPAFGDHIAGIKATLTNFDSGTFLADIDVTEYVEASYPYSTAFLGVATFFGSPAAPAISWGDGSTVPPFGNGPSTGIPAVAYSTSIGGQNVDVYRGSFSHAYADAGPYTVTVHSVNSAGTPASSGYDVITGNYAVATYTSGGNTYSVAHLTNTLQIGAAAPEDIPMASTWALILLAGLLVGSALVVLPR